MAKKHETKKRGGGGKGRGGHHTGTRAHSNEYTGPGEEEGAGEMLARESAGGREDRARMPEDRYPSAKTPAAEKDVPDRSRGDEED